MELPVLERAITQKQKKWFEAAVENDESGAALFNLGIMYAQGWGVMQDNAEATELYRKAALKKSCRGPV